MASKVTLKMGCIQFRQRRLILLVALVLPALFWTCSINPKKMDLVNYVNRDIIGIASLEAAAWEQYSAVVGENFTTEAAVLEALNNNVIPIYERFFHLLERIQPEDGELAQLHVLYIRGASKVLGGFRLKMNGIETQDVEMIIAGNQQIKEGAEDTYKWREQLLAMYDSRKIKAMKKKKKTALDKVYQFLLTWDAATVGAPVSP